MRKVALFVAVAALLLLGGGKALAGFYGISNELGYQGTVWNITENTGPWNTSTPRDATLYTVVNTPSIYSDYNMLASNWSEHAISNQNNSFFQLAEDGNPSVTSANGWWSSDLKTFTMTVTGANAPYPYSRFWQPDTVGGVAWGVTFTNYNYTFVATFQNAATLDGATGLYNSSGSADTITGSFTGQFVVTDDVNKNPITNGDTYGFKVALSKASLDPLDPTSGWDGSPVSAYSAFGSTAVPEPVSIFFLGFTLIGVAGARKYFRS